MSIRITILRSIANINTPIERRLIESANTLRDTRSSLIIGNEIRGAVCRGHARLSTIVHEIVVRAYIHAEFAIFICVIRARGGAGSAISVSPGSSRAARSHNTSVIAIGNIGK